ncbi:hypothetical protein HELRODRAFT_185433 [Helobdella robusta]|uniref:WH1 domain-containing protein n=1 Tax=Helobdella robusta TaxID=6412 RepID=T1FMT6_HELRO|nr:hypothetical protein HELRODRAFT_185433 [Helobdella robusta]ESO08231.1 hypothetical protein HELRODRAFT_185433 [Helobdella robusta]
MGEVPISTVSAHVFQIDSETKKKWLPTSEQAVDVSFYFDNAHNTYRLISLENNKVLINCTLLPNMKFVKTSQKFGQWIDSQVATVYGLGFSSETELNRFADKFEEIRLLLSDKKRGLDPPPPVKPKSSSLASDKLNEVEKTEISKIASNLRHVHVSNSSNNSGSNKNEVATTKISNGFSSNSPSSPSTTTTATNSYFHSDSNCNNIKCTHTIAQLKVENDKLKLELAQSSARAKEWEVEMQSLRNKNALLTTTLEESHENVEQWRKQLASYTDEIALNREKIAEVERLQESLLETQSRLAEVERNSNIKQTELDQLRSTYNDLKRQDLRNQQSSSMLQSLEKENSRLKLDLRDLKRELEGQQQQLSSSTNSFASNRAKVQTLQEQISHKINELYEMNDQLAEQLQMFS